MEDMRFATLRLGKTSVDEIKRMDKSSPGIVATDFSISVKCTQVPPDLNSGTYVFIWLGSDNSKGIQTEWKQGFKSIGAVSSVVRAEQYNDESTILVSIKYIFQNAGMERQTGTLPQTYRFVEKKHLQAVPTALKHSMLTGNVILRFCNLSDEETTVSVSQPEVYTYDLLEKDQLQKEEKEIVLGKHEIRTIGWRA